MINLIPQEEKKEMITGFYYKLVVLFLMTASVSVLVFFVAILPSYFLSATKINIINEKLETQKQELVPLPDQETLLVTKDLDNKLNMIENAENDRFIVSQKVINAIISKKMQNIRITDISYGNDPLKGRTTSIEGEAPSREVLLSFRLALEESSLFKQVDLPISNFIKGSNIRFYLNLILQ
ncbi:hypothetical protein A3A05_02445 [Candidatus Nomurabacteria bacterium RIFCSPLOWO2_01_FULL_41_12]|uniref:Uncharacterized protein n=1 Tax=Candidatus Nomurabacteria bacterium RIFCSPLOWO2_01_FULL_41_12 TaxID=1801774 RepID=A0A1F6WUY3_9BACT|nr:MAG: hypothetical protein A2732_00285 [Candidatus Nomurabacteria bacterium RIFCSPHIGHO2_01_FULL_40_10]OGI85565.1 MAG: hypothetical protein A3A05_02445 [Candidatus Nomurabacteria bacterium RIFCSPLOWO2_01_FULL_41_12]